MTRTTRYVGLTLLWLAFTGLGYVLVRHFGPDVSAELRDTPRVNAHRIDVALPDLDNQTRRLDTWRDGPMLINFWATWCPPCIKEIPMLIDLQDRYRDTGLTIVGVAVDETEPVRAFVEDMPLNYPILVGEQDGMQLATALGVDMLALPVSIFVDRHGNVLRQHLGEIDREDAELALADILPAR